MHQHRLCIKKLMQIICRGSKLWQLSACSVILYGLIKKRVNYLTKKWMYKKRKTFKVHASSHKPMKKCAMKMKQTNKKKWCTCKNIIDERKHFIRHIWKTGGNILYKLCVNNSRHNESKVRTICLLNWDAKGIVFQAWICEWASLNLQRLVYILRIGGTDFLHYWDYWFYMVRTYWVLDN